MLMCRRLTSTFGQLSLAAFSVMSEINVGVDATLTCLAPAPRPRVGKHVTDKNLSQGRINAELFSPWTEATVKCFRKDTTPQFWSTRHVFRYVHG